MHVENLGVMAVQDLPQVLLHVQLLPFIFGFFIVVLHRALVRLDLAALLLIGLVIAVAGRLRVVIESTSLIIIVCNAGLTGLVLHTVRFRDGSTLSRPIVNGLLMRSGWVKRVIVNRIGLSLRGRPTMGRNQLWRQ
jgi:hypothetical protein